MYVIDLVFVHSSLLTNMPLQGTSASKIRPTGIHRGVGPSLGPPTVFNLNWATLWVGLGWAAHPVEANMTTISGTGSTEGLEPEP